MEMEEPCSLAILFFFCLAIHSFVQFVRQSSMRSSLASARNGLNRYFGSHMRRITAESFSQCAPLPGLGEPVELVRPTLLLGEMDASLPEIDLNEFSITPLT